MRAMGPSVVATPWLHPGQAEWIVTLTTPPRPPRMDVVEPRERRMHTVEHRWPGARFRGLRTSRTDGASARTAQDAPATPRRSQREIVMASLLRCPSAKQRGTANGWGTYR
jgi:hypothetical protein